MKTHSVYRTGGGEGLPSRHFPEDPFQEKCLQTHRNTKEPTKLKYSDQKNFFFLLMFTPVAYGSFQARGGIRAASETYPAAYGNV